MLSKNSPGCGSCCDTGPCAMVCTSAFDACSHTAVVGATVALTQGATTTSCTTDGAGRCCNGSESGAYSVTVTATGYVTKTVTGTAKCPPPPVPVAYGPRYPGTWADDATIGTGAWVSPSNAASANSAFATAPSQGNTPTHYLKGTASGSFAIPTGGTEAIYRVRVEVGCKADAASTDHDVRLVFGGTIQATSKAVGTALSTSLLADLRYAWTAPADLPTIAQANAGDIGLAFSAKSPGASSGTQSLANASTMATGTSNTPTVAITSSTAGNFLVAVVQCLSGTITAPTGWSTAVNTGALANPVAIFYKENVSGGITSVAASLSGSVRWLMAVEEWSGVATSGALGQTATATGTSASPVSGTITTTNANDLIIALIGIGNADSLSSPTNSFTLQSQATNGAAQALGMLHRVVSSTGSYSAGATSSGVDPYSGAIASFKGGTSDATISVDYGRIYVDTSRTTYEITVPLARDCAPATHIAPCCDPVPDPLNVTVPSSAGEWGTAAGTTVSVPYSGFGFGTNSWRWGPVEVDLGGVTALGARCAVVMVQIAFVDVCHNASSPLVKWGFKVAACSGAAPADLVPFANRQTTSWIGTASCPVALVATRNPSEVFPVSE